MNPEQDFVSAMASTCRYTSDAALPIPLDAEGLTQVFLLFAIKSSDELKKGKKITSQVLIHLRG